MCCQAYFADYEKINRKSTNLSFHPNLPLESESKINDPSSKPNYRSIMTPNFAQGIHPNLKKYLNFKNKGIILYIFETKPDDFCEQMTILYDLGSGKLVYVDFRNSFRLNLCEHLGHVVEYTRFNAKMNLPNEVKTIRGLYSQIYPLAYCFCLNLVNEKLFTTYISQNLNEYIDKLKLKCFENSKLKHKVLISTNGKQKHDLPTNFYKDVQMKSLQVLSGLDENWFRANIIKVQVRRIGVFSGSNLFRHMCII